VTAPRVVRLADLEPVPRAIVAAALAAERAADKRKAAPAIVTPEAAQEDRRARDEHPAAA
jgi:hypothetical protein